VDLIDIEMRLIVLETMVADLTARRFADEAAMRRWTEENDAQLTAHEERSKHKPEVIARHRAVWDAMLATVRARFQHLNRPPARDPG
jgi:hypothetical protein